MHRVGLIAASIAASFFGIAVCMGGCAGVDALGTPLDNAKIDAGASSQTASNGGDDTNCTPVGAAPYTPPTAAQIAALPSCCTTGAAHCVPSAELPPGTSVSALATCTGGACVPDSLITSGGAAPPACKSLNGADGVCLSLCVPQVAQYSTLLPQDICQPDERCAPCISPLDGSDTGACEIGKSTAPSGGGTTCAPTGDDDDGASTPPPAVDAGPPVCPHVGAPVLDPSSLPTCDPNGGAHCLSTSLVPASEASQLATCPSGLCVPDSFIESGGQFIPKTCTSLLGAEGRCLDEMIPQVAAELSEIPVDVCQTFERCVPCYDPTTGKSTGACNLSCDPGPTKPPVKVQTCCSEKGTDVGECLPTSAIPKAEQSNLKQDTCTTAATLCVPTEMTSPTFKPTTCTAQGFLGILSGQSYTGVCLSKCLDFGFGSGLEIAQGNCDGTHECAPCTNPLTNAPTGAPGCPNTPDGGL